MQADSWTRYSWMIFICVCYNIVFVREVVRKRLLGKQCHHPRKEREEEEEAMFLK